MKFYSVAISMIAMITAVFGAGMMMYQGQYFRAYLLALFIVMQCDILATRMRIERDQ